MSYPSKIVGSKSVILTRIPTTTVEFLRDLADVCNKHGMGLQGSIETYKFDVMEFHFDFRFNDSVDQFQPTLLPIQGDINESV
ncbi:hypothetical protein TacPo2_19 [Pantoea bacteriophage TacPo2]